MAQKRRRKRAPRKQSVSDTRPFSERFDIPLGVDEARRRFINRAKNQLFHATFAVNDHLREQKWWFARCVANELGEEFMGVDDFSFYFKGDFFLCLQSIEVIHQRMSEDPELDDKVIVNVFESGIKILLDMSEVDLGVRWQDGHFLPSGAKELDTVLVNEPLLWLRSKNLTSVLAPFEKALDHYMHSVKKPDLLADVVTDAYEALEAMAKLITGRKTKDLSANRDLLIKTVNVSEPYKRIMAEYISYANSFRHAVEEGRTKPDAARSEVESFLYMTGVFIRLSILSQANE